MRTRTLTQKATLILRWWQRTGDAPASAEIIGAWDGIIQIRCLNEETGEYEQATIYTHGLRNEQIGREISRRAENIATDEAERAYSKLRAECLAKVVKSHPEITGEIYHAARKGALNDLLV